MTASTSLSPKKNPFQSSECDQSKSLQSEIDLKKEIKDINHSSLEDLNVDVIKHILTFCKEYAIAIFCLISKRINMMVNER